MAVPVGRVPGGMTANRRENLDRAEKSELVSTLGEVFKSTTVVVVAHYAGLTVAQMQTLRRQMQQAGASVKVAKNRLAKIALEGTDVASIARLLKGPALIAFSGDPVAAAKVAVDFAKNNERLVILGGAMGNTALNPDGIKSLATLPSLDELRAKLVGLHPGAGDEARAARHRAGCEARACHLGLCVKTPPTAVSKIFECNDSNSKEVHMADLEKIVDDLSSLTVLEASELAKLLEEKWGVSAAAAVAVAAGPAGVPPPLPAEEKTEFTVVLAAAGDKKIEVIKEVRAHHRPRPEGSQGSRRGCAEAGQGRRQQG